MRSWVRGGHLGVLERNDWKVEWGVWKREGQWRERHLEILGLGGGGVGRSDRRVS